LISVVNLKDDSEIKSVSSWYYGCIPFKDRRVTSDNASLYKVSNFTCARGTVISVPLVSELERLFLTTPFNVDILPNGVEIALFFPFFSRKSLELWYEKKPALVRTFFITHTNAFFIKEDLNRVLGQYSQMAGSNPKLVVMGDGYFHDLLTVLETNYGRINVFRNPSSS
jgi:hypothetical protein